jgi:GntR family transcriptional regulator/MocR family aminotransferase
MTDRRLRGPLFVRLASAIAQDIRRGVLRAGDRLPSTRTIARDLDVNRNTVVAAFEELQSQGWIICRGAAGTFVAPEIPDRAPRAAGRLAPAGLAQRAGFDMRTIASPPWPGGPVGVAGEHVRYRISIGVPDPRLVPVDALARAYRRALRERRRTTLEYGDARGTVRLRTAIATLLRHARGIPCGPENVMITNGSQMALDLAARLLLERGAAVAVEELGYRQAWRVFEETGARLEPVRVDAAGLVVDELPACRAVYVTPHHQYPTTVTMSAARRIALLAGARARGLAVLEDDYDHEFHFDGRPVAPLAANDPGGHVIYIGTLSKVLAPGLRLGFVAAPERVIERLAQLRGISDRQGDHIVEHAVAELIEDGELQRHTRKARRIYGERREALVTTLARELPGVLEVALPAGGITVWARVRDGVAVERWRQRALAEGVALATARDFDLAGRTRPFVRLAFARYTPAEMTDAVRRLARALPR